MLRELPDAASWSWFALDVSVKATLLLFVVAGLVAIFARSSAAVRHRIWTLAFVGLLLLPLASAKLPSWSLPIIPSEWLLALDRETTEKDERLDTLINESQAEKSDSSLHSETDSAAARNDHAELPDLAGSGIVNADHSWTNRDLAKGIGKSSFAQRSTSSTRSRSTQGASALYTRLPWIVLIGAIMTLLPLVGGTLRNLHLRFFGSEIQDRAWHKILIRSRRHLGLRRRVRLISGAADQMPMTFGWINPVVVLPDSATSWTNERRQVVLLHELAHVHRYDVPVQVIARLACAMFWFHPLVWWALRQMRLERELACDDCVLMAGQSASNYARELLEIARAHRVRLPLANAALSMARPSQLEGRLLAVLDARRSRSPVTLRRTLGLSLAFVILIITLGIPRAAMRAAVSQPVLAISNAPDVGPLNSNKPIVSVTSSKPLASEPADDGELTFARTFAMGDLVVDYSVHGTATSAKDFAALTGSVTIRDGSLTATVPVSPIDDGIVDGEETVVVMISPRGNYEIGSSATATVTIADNELPPIAGRWKFDRNLEDLAGSDECTFHGGAPAYAPGKVGQALDLDGMDDYFEVPYTNKLNTLTISAWVKPSDVTSVAILALSTARITDGSNMIRINGDSKIEYYIFEATGEPLITGTTIVQPDTWYHIAVVASNRGLMRLYVNGVAEGTTARVSKMWDDGDRFRVGIDYRGGGFGPFEGQIDDLRIYEHALGPAEIRAIYQEVANVAAPNVRDAKTDPSGRSFTTRLRSRRPSPVTSVAYQFSEVTAGNQRSLDGGVGLDFDVRVPISVVGLGMFDHLGDGIDPSTSPSVQLWLRDPKGTPNDSSDDMGLKVLATQTFEAGDESVLRRGHRFKPLPEPMVLPPGSYSVVVYGLAKGNPFFALSDDSAEPHGSAFAGGLPIDGLPGTVTTVDNDTAILGKVGGTFARNEKESYFADTHLEQQLTLETPISASGVFTCPKGDAAKYGTCFIGHFSSSTHDDKREFMGMELIKGGARGWLSARARIYCRNGEATLDQVSSYVTINQGVATDSLKFEYSYDPGYDGDPSSPGPEGRLAIHVFNDAGSINGVAYAFNGGVHRATGATFDSFGVGVGPTFSLLGIGPPEIVTMFVDDLAYSGHTGIVNFNTDPGWTEVGNSNNGNQYGWAAQAISLNSPETGNHHLDMSRFGRRWLNKGFAGRSERIDAWQAAVIPVGSRLGEGKPGEFPTTVLDKRIGCGAGSFEFVVGNGQR